MALAFCFALPPGWERGKGRHGAGLRTFPVVSMASCGYALPAARLPGADAECLTRVLQGPLAGIGFIGGGAILRQGGRVRSLATAASTWNTGAIGAAVALGRIEIALVLSTANLISLIVLAPVVAHSDEPADGEDGNEGQAVERRRRGRGRAEIDS